MTGIVNLVVVAAVVCWSSREFCNNQKARPVVVFFASKLGGGELKIGGTQILYEQKLHRLFLSHSFFNRTGLASISNSELS